MARRERIQKQAQPAERAPEVEEHTPAPQADTTATDDLLDEIDSVLEENAAEFVAAYVQKGGQ